MPEYRLLGIEENRVWLSFGSSKDHEILWVWTRLRREIRPYRGVMQRSVLSHRLHQPHSPVVYPTRNPNSA